MAEAQRVPRLRHGPGRLLVGVYAVLALSATARAGYQLATDFSTAPLAYLLSAVAAAVYCVATVALARATAASARVARAAITFELVGVVGVGLATVVDARAFPDATVWSRFGSGYGYLPLVLPVAGLVWLARTRRAQRAQETQETRQGRQARGAVAPGQDEEPERGAGGADSGGGAASERP